MPKGTGEINCSKKLNSNLIYFHTIGGKIITIAKQKLINMNSLKFFLLIELIKIKIKKQKLLKMKENFARKEKYIIINEIIIF